MDVIPSKGWFEESKNYYSKAPKIITEKEALFNLDWKIVEKEIIHVFTHFRLNCTLAIAYINDKDISKNQLENKSFQFVKRQNLKELAVPSLINKIIKYLEDEKLF